MRTGLRVLWCAEAVVLAAAACAQSPTASGARAAISSEGAVPATVASPSLGEIVREINDPNTGGRWLLMREGTSSGGPGRLVLVAGERDASGTILRPANHASETVHPPAIRAGDRLIVEEHTAVADAVLEARALTPAALGSTLNVRLAIGGKVVRAVALGPGRAALQPETAVRP